MRVSVGGSFAMVAAADARISDDVHFVNVFGPYYDLESLMQEAASRSVLYDGERTPWEPHSLTLQVLSHELIETVDDPQDVAVLTAHYLVEMAVNDAELSALSLQGSTVARLIDGVTPEEAEALYLMLPLDFRDRLADISPSNTSEGCGAPAGMHRRDDRHVPVAESRRLVRPVGTGRVPDSDPFFNHTVPGEEAVLTHWASFPALAAHVRPHPHRPLARAIAGRRHRSAICRPALTLRSHTAYTGITTLKH